MARFLWLLPLFTGSLVIATLMFCYLYIVFADESSPWLLTISFATKYAWASQVFTLGFVTFSFLMMAIFTVWYTYFELLNKRRNSNDKKTHRWNLASYVLALVGCCGGVTMASFQLKDPVSIFHDVGAVFAFLTMCVYGWLHFVVSYRLNYTRLLYARFGLALFGTLGFFLFILFEGFFSGDDEFTLSWMSGLAEYTFALVMTAYYMTFAVDFRAISIELIVIRLESADLKF
jgi:hypothetical protein